MNQPDTPAIPDRYEIVRPLGRGGMATAYLVRDRLRDETVALKLLAAAAPALTHAFRNEFSLLTRVVHPRLTRVRDFGAARSDRGTLCFYTADFVDGEELAHFADGASWEQLVDPVADVLAALDFLHGAGLRHGDVKPANILVDHNGRAVLIDLGCARPIDRRRGSFL